MIHSISWRLQILYGLLLLLTLISLSVTAHLLEKSSQLNDLDVALQLRATRVIGPLHRLDLPIPQNADGSVPRIESPRHNDLFNSNDLHPFYYRVWGKNDPRTIVLKSDTGPDNIPIPNVPERVLDSGDVQNRDDFRERVYLNQRGLLVLVGRNATAEFQGIKSNSSKFAFICLFVFVVGLIVSHTITQRALKPVSEIGKAAKRIADGSLDERIETDGNRSELGELSEVLNRTFDKLEQEYRRQEQFTADASHELRTPVAVILSEIQSAPKNSRSIEEYEECLEVCEESATAMQVLLQQLLTLAQFDAGNGIRETNEIDFKELVENCISQATPFATKKNLTINRKLSEVVYEGDSDRLGQLVTNLLTNAITYNSENGEIGVELCESDDQIRLLVRDTGIGIAEDDIPQLFERFFRADKARFYDEGQSGLGLAICKEVTEAHGGKITVKSKLGDGTSFTVDFPAKKR